MRSSEYPPNTTELLPDDQYGRLMQIESARFDTEFALAKLRLEMTGIASAITAAGLVTAREMTVQDISPDATSVLDGVIAANGIALAFGGVVLGVAYGMRQTWRNRRLRQAANAMDDYLRQNPSKRKFT